MCEILCTGTNCVEERRIKGIQKCLFDMNTSEKKLNNLRRCIWMNIYNAGC